MAKKKTTTTSDKAPKCPRCQAVQNPAGTFCWHCGHQHDAPKKKAAPRG